MDLVRADVHHSRISQRRTEGVKLALPEIAELNSVGFGEPERVSRPDLIGIKPSAPDDHVIGLGRRIFVEFRQTLRCDDTGIAALAALTHQADDCLGRFRIPGTALQAVDVRLIEDH